jgi:glucans biosynthesis protein C
MTQMVKPRMFFVDNLRVFLIVLVILVHLTITYGSPTGLWYIHEGTVGMPAGLVYVFFQVICQAFFMGLLFLLSGYFTPASYDRKGPKRFFTDRLVRLGIPILIFILVIDPLMQYALGAFQGPLLNLFLTNPFAGLGFGPLLFVEALLFFAIAYLAWRSFSSKPTKSRVFPRNRFILLFGLLLGAATFAVRLVFTVGYTFDLLNFQLPFFPQYIALFIVGLIAFRGNWLQMIPKSTGRFWGKIVCGFLVLLPIIIVAGATNGDFSAFYGGFYWQAAAYAFWEQFFCVAVAISLTVWFREKLNWQNRFTKALSDSSYAAYILQAPILIYLALSLQSVQIPLLLKFAVVSPIALVLCFGIAYLIRKIPEVDTVL